MSRAKKAQRSSRLQIASFVCALVVGIPILSFSPRMALAQSEDQIKAAFLFNFARYVEWPEGAFASAEAPIRICLLGSDAFGSVVSQVVSGKNVAGRSLRVTTANDLELAASCHIVFVGDQAKAARLLVISALAQAPVFTVSDSEGFARDGGVANFFRADHKVRFEINSEAARRAGLKISSRLLRLARVVE